MHAVFGNQLPIKMGKFLQEPDILQQLHPAWSGGQHVLVVGYRCSGVGGQFLLAPRFALFYLGAKEIFEA